VIFIPAKMPVDSKRLPVPDETFAPSCFIRKDKKFEKDLVAENGCRQDKRLAGQVRPIFMRTGVVSQAKGSSYIEMNETKIICAVYGPREVTRREDFSMKGQLNCEIKFATFSGELRRHHQQDAQEKDLSVIIQQALEPAVRLEKFPKSRMDVFVTVLQDDGGALAGGMTAASVALADAGVEMYDLVIGASLRRSGDLLILDPVKQEEYQPKDSQQQDNSGSMTVGLMPSLYQVAALSQKGHMSLDAVSQAMQHCIEGCQKIYPVAQEVLARAVRTRLKTHT